MMIQKRSAVGPTGSLPPHLTPRSPRWALVGPWFDPVHGVVAGGVYEREGTRVISSRVVAVYPGGIGEGPQDHVSISRRGARPPASAVRQALQAFGIADGEEDNHHPGIARHFWRPLDPAHRVACECKTTEDLIRDPDGYAWTNPNDGSPCRGCAYARTLGKYTGRSTCPIHGA